MPSELGIYNRALSQAGVSSQVGSLTENSRERKICSLWYEHTRDYVLKDFAWPFATRDIALAVTTDTAIGWQYAYGYPEDALNIIAVTDLQGLRTTLNYVISYPEQVPYLPIRYPWKIAAHSDLASQVILTDVPEAYAIYTIRYADTGSFPADFAEALQWKLTENIAPGLKAKTDFANRATAKYAQSKAVASANALNEQRPDQEPDASSIRARG